MQGKRIWIGRWTIFVAAGHTVIGLLAGWNVVGGVIQRGVFNAVGGDPKTGFIVWFLLCGAVLALLGMAITAIERSGQLALARPLGFGILALTTLGVVLMPVSGFWLMFPVVVGLLRGGSATQRLQPAL
jgi:hypothetical protein